MTEVLTNDGRDSFNWGSLEGSHVVQVGKLMASDILADLEVKLGKPLATRAGGEQPDSPAMPADGALSEGHPRSKASESEAN